MNYKNFISTQVKKDELDTLKKAIWLYNQENDYHLEVFEMEENKKFDNLVLVRIKFLSKDYLIGFENTYVLFELGKYFRDVEVLY